MIQLLQRGDYVLGETKDRALVLQFNGKEWYKWFSAAGFGDMLVRLQGKCAVVSTLAVGKYRVCNVVDEPDVTNTQHLELSLGNGQWQSYLLLSGLPTLTDNRKRIMPTEEMIITPTINHPAL